MTSFILGVLVAITPAFVFAEEAAPAEEAVLKLQEVQCRGNEAASCPFISSHLYLVNGDAINEEEIQNAKLRLSLLVNFKSVDIRLEKGAEKNHAIVVIDVVEASPVSSEILIGTSYQGGNASQRVAARVSHNNLFGTGKILDLELDSRTPLGTPEHRNFSARMQYVDPHLFGSAKNFMIAGAEYQNSKYVSRDNYSLETEHLGFDFHLGRRFNNFSYFTVGYQNRPLTRYRTKIPPQYTDLSSDMPGYSNQAIISTGWNSEDDPYFATRGDRAHFSTSWSWTRDERPYSLRIGLSYRRTWKSGSGSIWYYNFGAAPRNEFRSNLDEQMDISVGYAKDFGKSDRFGGIERARWYIEPGLPSSYSTYSGVSLGLKTGLRLDTKVLGIVDLYAFGSSNFNGYDR
jgi:outer membrane protein assembly factor BamA